MHIKQRSKIERIIDNLNIDNLQRAINNPDLITVYIESLYETKSFERFKFELAKQFDINRNQVDIYLSELESENKLIDEFEKAYLEANGKYLTTMYELISTYLVCRIVEPKFAVVTGTAYGGFDTFVLLGMMHNDRGKLLSIDLPGKWTEYDVGYAIPNELHHRWDQVLEDSKKSLTDILKINDVDLAIHDSNHEYEHMKWEFEQFVSNMQEGVIMSHDILHNSAWFDFVDKYELENQYVVTTGVALV
jgi:hypothetical protein